MSNNFVNISLKDRGQAYSDAIEYKDLDCLFKLFKNLLLGTRTMVLKLKHLLMQLLYSIKKEKK